MTALIIAVAVALTVARAWAGPWPTIVVTHTRVEPAPDEAASLGTWHGQALP